MAVNIPFVQDLQFTYGASQQVSPKIRRIIANNPSPFTYFGTGTYLVGSRNVAVIDPGPADPDHVDAILRATQNEENYSSRGNSHASRSFTRLARC